MCLGSPGPHGGGYHGEVKPRATAAIFGAIAVLYIGMTAIWLKLDHAPPTWDDAGYLTNSLRLYDALTDGGLVGYARNFLTATAAKPPLIAALPTPVYLIAGRHTGAAYAVNLFSTILLFAAVFAMARKCAGPRAGLLAVYVVATMPMIYGLSRWYLVECTLIAVVAAAIWVLWESNRLEDTGRLFLFGLLCSAGLLLKFTFPLYVMVPFGYWLWQNPRAALRLKTIVAFATPLVVLALPWYLLHFRAALATALDTGSAEVAVEFVGNRVYSPAVLRAYFARLFNAGPALYFVLLPILLFLVYKRLAPGGREGLKLCALWASPLLFLLIWRSREARYAAPLFPAVAVALSVLLDAAMFRSRWNRAVWAALLLLPLIDMMQVSFGLFGGRPWKLGGLLFDPHNLVYARKFDTRQWPYGEILEELHRAARPPERPAETLLVGSDSPEFNADIFQLAAAERRLPFQTMTTAYEPSWKTVPPLLDWATFFIYEEGGAPRSIYFNRHQERAVREVRESGVFAELPLRRRLPDGGVLHAFENLSHNGMVRTGGFLPAGLQAIPAGAATFGDVLQLSRIGFRPGDGAVEVEYRWRCLRPPDREYWCFTHLLDATGQVVAYLDHRILNGAPPMTSWKPDDGAAERLEFRSPAIHTGGTYTLWVGLYDPGSGRRLAVSNSAFPVVDNGTAALVSRPR